MGGFGALSAMNYAIKKNRELLKANKKQPFERPRYYPKSSGNVFRDSKKLSEEERIKLINATWQSNKTETRKQIIVLIISFVLVGILVLAFLSRW